MRIEVSDEYDRAIFDALVAGVRAHNFEHVGEEVSRLLTVVARSDGKQLLGGVSGRTIYRQFLIDAVWVDKVARGSGLGRRLMDLAEAKARERGCLAAQVDTLSFQAPVFYRKLGFEVVGTVSGVRESPDRYFLLKRYE